MSAEVITLAPFKRANFDPHATAAGGNGALPRPSAERPFIPHDYKHMGKPVCGRCTLLLTAVITVGLPSLVWLIELCGRLT